MIKFYFNWTIDGGKYISVLLPSPKTASTITCRLSFESSLSLIQSNQYLFSKQFQHIGDLYRLKKINKCHAFRYAALLFWPTKIFENKEIRYFPLIINLRWLIQNLIICNLHITLVWNAAGISHCPGCIVRCHPHFQSAGVDLTWVFKNGYQDAGI